MANPTDIFDTAEGTPISASQAAAVALLPAGNIDGTHNQLSTTAQQAALAASTAAGSVGMQLIELWAPSISAQSHAFNITLSQWQFLQMVGKSIGEGSSNDSIELRVDSGSGAGYTAGVYNDSSTATNLDYANNQYRCCLNKIGCVSHFVSELFPVGPCLLVRTNICSATAGGRQEMFTGWIPNPATSLNIYSSIAAAFVANVSTVALYGIPVNGGVGQLVSLPTIVGTGQLTGGVYAVTATDSLLQVTATASVAAQINLLAGGPGLGIKIVNSGGNPATAKQVTIVPNGAQTILGQSSLVLDGRDSVILAYNTATTDWEVL